MDKRKIIAIIEVDADTAFEAIDDGPVPYLEKEFGWLEQSGISLKDCFIADDDEDDQQQAYLNYLVEWAFNHQGEDLKGVQPISFDKFCENECPCGGDSTNDCEGCDYSGDYHCVNGECVERGDPHTEADVPNTDNTALVCKRCGYKQSDEDTINTLKSHFPSMETHDIPYYCGACMDYANDDERAEMEQKMSGLSDPQIAETDVSNIRELIYERYKLHWMATHGYSLSQMVEELQNLSDESADGDSVTELFDEWELMHGFGGAIWSGQSEFFDNEYKEPAVISPLLYTTEERLAYLGDVATLRKGD